MPVAFNCQLGDLKVLGNAPPPAKLLKALAVIAKEMHPAFARVRTFKPEISFESCVLCSLAVRDFLNAIDIATMVRPVSILIRACENGKELHSLGIGKPFDDRPSGNGRYAGHLAAVAGNWLVDTTLYRGDEWRPGNSAMERRRSSRQ